MRQPLTFILCAMLIGCAATPGQRDAAGNPELVRLDAAGAAFAARQAPHPLSIEDVLALARQGHPPEEIVARMRATGTRLAMDPAQQTALRRQGASATLVDALVAAEAEAKRTDRLTEEADRAAERRAAERARQEAYRAWSADPYWMWPHPYLGYGWYGHRRDWYGGIGWGW